MKISDILTEDVIELKLDAEDKNDAINKMVDLAGRSGNILNLESVRNSVFDREQIVSTGVGKEFAFPHGKCEDIKNIVAAFAITAKPIDFDSIDADPVRYIFLLVGKENLLNQHLKLLSRISRLMNKDSFRDKLLAAESRGEVLDLFREEEQNYIDI
jgi:mannitol/fructose-specific phosphotransferase system IIA component (Ntr-type)